MWNQVFEAVPANADDDEAVRGDGGAGEVEGARETCRSELTLKLILSASNSK